LLKAGGWVFFGILLGRIVGFVRDLLVAHRFGASLPADMAVLAISVPDTLLNIIVGGSMGAALIPEFKRLSPAAASSLRMQASQRVALTFIPLAAVLALAAPWLVRVFAPGFQSGAIPESALLLRIVLWAIPLTALVAIDRAFLQAHGNFSISSMSTFVYNGALVVGLLIPAGSRQLEVLSVSAVCGAALNFGIQRLVALRYQSSDGQDHRHLVDRSLLIRYSQAFMAGGLIILMPTVARAVGSLQGKGNLAVLNYSLKLVELPLGVVLTVFSVVLFPTLAGMFAQHSSLDHGVKIARAGLRIVLIMAAAIAFPAAYFATDFARALFRHGALTDAAAVEMGHLSRIALIGMAGQAMYSILLAVLNAMRDMRTPFFGSIGAVCVYIPLALLFRTWLGTPGIVFAVVAVYWTLFIGQLLVAERMHKINLHSVLIEPGTLLALAACFGVFVPIALLAPHLPQHAWQRVLIALFAMLVCALTGILAVGDHRRKLMSRLGRATPTAS